MFVKVSNIRINLNHVTHAIEEQYDDSTRVSPRTRRLLLHLTMLSTKKGFTEVITLEGKDALYVMDIIDKVLSVKEKDFRGVNRRSLDKLK